MNVDLGKATEAGAEALAKFLGTGPLTIQDTDRFSNGAAGMILAAAYPHVFAAVVEALRARAEGDWESLGITGKGRLEGWQAGGAARWLARIAQEAQGE